MSRPADSLLRSCALLLLGAIALAQPPVADARTSDRSQPLDVEANSSDCTVTDNGPCTLVGDVQLSQGSLLVRAGRAVVHRANGDIRRVVLTGNAQMSQELDDGSRINARADNVDYDMASDTVVFTGNALIDQPGRGNIAGGRIAYNMKSGQVQGSGEGQGRVKMQFVPKNAQGGR